MDYIITFSDVMSALITLFLGFFGWYLKRQYDKREQMDLELKKQIKEGNEAIQERIEKNDQKVNERINKLEEKTQNDIQNIKKELNDIKGDFATAFVLREDFFLAMNRVEDTIKIISGKIDKLIFMGKENK